MITKKYKFSIATPYIKSEWSEEVELEFDDDLSEDEIDDQVSEIYSDWLFRKNGGTYSEIN